MFRINDITYTTTDIEEKHQYFSSLTLFKSHDSLRIAVCLEDNFTWLALCLYAKATGLSLMPIHPSTPREAAKKAAAKAQCSQLCYNTLEDIIELEQGHTEAEAPGLIQMSSGTTGEAKCIHRSWASIDAEIASYITTFQAADDMNPIVACPVTHSYGLICGVLVAIARGKTPMVITTINPKYVMKTLAKTEKPLLYSSPAMLQSIVSLWPKGEKIHAVMTSGTILSQHIFNAMKDCVSHLFQQYGCSEVGCISINQNMTSPQDVGTPLPHFEVYSGAGHSQAKEIVVRRKTGENTNAMPLVHTQDLGYFEDNVEGKPSLHFVSRMDDTIIVSGLNVYPSEVEDNVLTHSEIDDAVVFKVDDALSGQRVAMQYTSESAIDEAQLRTWFTENLAPHQIPVYLNQVEAIERLANGKVNRKSLSKKHAESMRNNSTLANCG